MSKQQITTDEPFSQGFEMIPTYKSLRKAIEKKNKEQGFFNKSISTKYDALLVPVLWLCGSILFFQGWRLDPILQFLQFLLSGMLLFVSYENIKLRELIKKLKNTKI